MISLYFDKYARITAAPQPETTTAGNFDNILLVTYRLAVLCKIEATGNNDLLKMVPMKNYDTIMLFFPPS